MQGYESYIKPELGIVVAMLYVIGMIIKQTEKINNKYIPSILGVLGIILCYSYVVSLEGFTAIGIFTGVTQGVLCAGAAVYVNQLIKQSGK
jgi:hypothetical protein